MTTNFDQLPQDAREEIKDCVRQALEYFDGEVAELHNEAFNTDYFIIGRYAAEQWLVKNIGVFSAIDAIQEYEKFNFGEVNTNLSEAEHVCNMFVYIAGEEMLAELESVSDNWDEEITEEIKTAILEEMSEL